LLLLRLNTDAQTRGHLNRYRATFNQGDHTQQGASDDCQSYKPRGHLITLILFNTLICTNLDNARRSHYTPSQALYKIAEEELGSRCDDFGAVSNHCIRVC
jgi:hypothetical protein